MKPKCAPPKPSVCLRFSRDGRSLPRQPHGHGSHFPLALRRRGGKALWLARKRPMLAYLLLVHRYPKQFKRLFRAIHHPDNHYLVHVDLNSGPELADEIGAFLRPYPNAELLTSQGAVWGGYSLVDVELRGMAKLLRMDRDWTYFINLSGQDFPLKTQGEIRAFLGRANGKEYLRVLDQQKLRPETMNRILHHFEETSTKMVQSPGNRPYLTDATPYIGNQWMMVTRAFCQYVCHAPEANRFKAFYRNSFIADEGLFQTVMMSDGAHGEIVNSDMRAIDWVADGDIKLRPRTYRAADAPALLASGNLFARKFDLTVDAEIIDILEARLTSSAPTRQTKREAPEPVGNRSVLEAIPS